MIHTRAKSVSRAVVPLLGVGGVTTFPSQGGVKIEDSPSLAFDRRNGHGLLAEFMHLRRMAFRDRNMHADVYFI